MDVVVPGGCRSAPDVLCEGAAGGLCAVRGGVCRDRFRGYGAVYAAQGLGSCSAARGRERPSGGEYGATRSRCGRRLGAASTAASRVRDSQLSSLDFWFIQSTQNGE